MIDTQFIYIFIHAKFSQSINKPPSMIIVRCIYGLIRRIQVLATKSNSCFSIQLHNQQLGTFLSVLRAYLFIRDFYQKVALTTKNTRCKWIESV